MKLNNSTEIVSVTIINMADGTEEKLYEIEGSRCHFCKEFDYQDYVIRLRLDWRDVISGDPVLDADIWRINRDINRDSDHLFLFLLWATY